MVDPFSFSQSRAVRGYSPQFLDTAPDAASATPGASTDLTNRLLQIMSGQLGGTLSGGEKLSALGALLKSVSRGSQTSPQQVMQGIQQQKMAEVQGALQIQELRKAAQRQAQTELQRQMLINQEKDPRRKALLQMATAEDIGAIARKEFEPRDPLQGLSTIEAQVARQVGYGTPEFNRIMRQYLSRDKFMSGPYGIYREPGLSIPMDGETSPPTSQPTEAEVFSEARAAISKGADPDKVKARVRSLGFDDGKL